MVLLTRLEVDQRLKFSKEFFRSVIVFMLQLLFIYLFLWFLCFALWFVHPIWYYFFWKCFHRIGFLWAFCCYGRLYTTWFHVSSLVLRMIWIQGDRSETRCLEDKPAMYQWFVSESYGFLTSWHKIFQDKYRYTNFMFFKQIVLKLSKGSRTTYSIFHHRIIVERRRSIHANQNSFSSFL